MRVMVVDDHPMWRQTMRALLERHDTGEILEAGDGPGAIELAEREKPDVIVIDMGLPGMTGDQAIAAIVAARPEARILVLSSSDEPADVVRAVQAGAAGYLSKTAESSDVIDAVRRLAAGEMVFSPDLARVVLNQMRGGAGGQGALADPLGELTSRERDVLRLMAEGFSNQAIGEQLHLSGRTVESHISAIFEKLGIEPAVEAHRRVMAVIAYLRST
jgi:DNA-binding NarL/FixJ family response regulator